MISIRNYTEQDAAEVGRLIADTYSEFNLAFAAPAELALFLGPFRHAHSPDEGHQRAIARVLQSPMFYVAETGGEIAGQAGETGQSVRPQELSSTGDWPPVGDAV